MENINSTNKGTDLLLANEPRIVLRWTERMPQRIQRHRRAPLHRSAHRQREQDQTEKSSSGLDWQQKGIWYGPAKLDNKLPQNVQNIGWSYKLYRENHENLESGIDSGICTITFNIYYLQWRWYHLTPYSENVQPDKNLVNRRKNQSPNVHGRHQTVGQKMKKNWKLKYTQWEYTTQT